nr:MAG TPA: hypothetical protein [Caudoviricetes sp.]
MNLPTSSCLIKEKQYQIFIGVGVRHRCNSLEA